MARPRLITVTLLMLAAMTFTMCCKQTRHTETQKSDGSAGIQNDSGAGSETAPRTDTASGAPGSREARTEQAPVKTGIVGRVEIWEGNFMPMVEPERRANQIKPGANRRVRVYEPVKVSGGMAEAKRSDIPTRMVAETKTDSNGRYAISVPPGNYSIFVEEDGGWYYNGFNEQGVQGAVTVREGEVSEVVIKITTKATF